jgi:hypothetical protein
MSNHEVICLCFTSTFIIRYSIFDISILRCISKGMSHNKTINSEKRS